MTTCTACAATTAPTAGSTRAASACATRAAMSTAWPGRRSEEHTSELQSLMRISYAVFCLKKKKVNVQTQTNDDKAYTTQCPTSSHRTSSTTLQRVLNTIKSQPLAH